MDFLWQHRNNTATEWHAGCLVAESIRCHCTVGWLRWSRIFDMRYLLWLIQFYVGPLRCTVWRSRKAWVNSRRMIHNKIAVDTRIIWHCPMTGISLFRGLRALTAQRSYSQRSQTETNIHFSSHTNIHTEKLLSIRGDGWRANSQKK